MGTETTLATPLDRLIAAITDDGPVPRREQLELVDALLHRRVVPTALARTFPPDPLCPNCKTLFDPDGFCGLCGRQLTTAPTGTSDQGAPVGAEGGQL